MEQSMKVQIVPMNGDHLDEVAALERACFPDPWSRQLLEELVGLGVLWSMKLELEEGEVTAYKLAEPLGLVPFLLAAQGFMETSSNYVYFYDDEKPLLRGAEWKRKRGENDETEEG